VTKKKEKILFAKSALLNKAGYNSTAAISATVINDYGDNPSIELQLTDCYKAITFDFSLYEEIDRDNTLYKLDTLLDVLVDFRHAVSDACDKAKIVQIKREKASRKAKKNGKDVNESQTCELCERERTTTFHHLVPKKSHKRSRVTKLHTKEYMNAIGVDLCKSCHKTVHKFFTHMELALEYYTLDLLKGNEKLMKFVIWLKKQKKDVKV